MSATPDLLSTAEPPPSQAHAAYEALRDMLVTLEIRPGEPISEAVLMERLGVGRTPLREAVNRLTEERLVQKYPRRGTFAAEINLADLPLLTDLRREIEALAAGLAAYSATESDREALRALSPQEGDVRPGGDPAEQMRKDTAIHRHIYEATHNHFLIETASRYHAHSTRLWYQFTDRLTDLGSHVDEHRALIAHICAGEADRAREVARHHVDNFAQAVRDLI
ncbi:GntR family transcriptional regulator [Euzebya tangerina]|uniref:GntR family transcriptional regulator n=1 Tax=Euzebya tangerina TaxID=591198 RepID=UPI000E31C8EC|nr:GntR family transcriptional regulator [Euzebya tangerina]